MLDISLRELTARAAEQVLAHECGSAWMSAITSCN